MTQRCLDGVFIDINVLIIVTAVLKKENKRLAESLIEQEKGRERGKVPTLYISVCLLPCKSLYVMVSNIDVVINVIDILIQRLLH